MVYTIGVVSVEANSGARGARIRQVGVGSGRMRFGTKPEYPLDSKHSGSRVCDLSRIWCPQVGSGLPLFSGKPAVETNRGRNEAGISFRISVIEPVAARSIKDSDGELPVCTASFGSGRPLLRMGTTMTTWTVSGESGTRWARVPDGSGRVTSRGGASGTGRAKPECPLDSG